MDNKIVVDHNAGFFSNCSIKLKRIVDFYNKNKLYPVVDSSKQWEFYKDKPGDLTPVFFKEDLSFDETIPEYVDYYESNEDQFIEYNKLDVNLKYFIRKYFEPSDLVYENFNKLLETYNIDLSQTIGVCFRGNDKHKETNLPSHEEMIKKIIEVKSKFPDHRLLIQSDEIEFYQKVLSIFPDSIYFKEVVKINKNLNYAIQYAVPVGMRTQQALLFLSICIILSRCSKLIINSGNVSMWICLYRNNFEGVYQYLNHKEYIYGVYNTNYKKLENNWIENE